MHQESSLNQKKEKRKKEWMLKTPFSYYKNAGHQEANYWKLHPELCPKKDKKKIVVDSMLVNTGKMKRIIYVRKNA